MVGCSCVCTASLTFPIRPSAAVLPPISPCNSSSATAPPPPHLPLQFLKRYSPPHTHTSPPAIPQALHPPPPHLPLQPLKSATAFPPHHPLYTLSPPPSPHPHLFLPLPSPLPPPPPPRCGLACSCASSAAPCRAGPWTSLLWGPHPSPPPPPLAPPWVRPLPQWVSHRCVCGWSAGSTRGSLWLSGGQRWVGGWGYEGEPAEGIKG